MWFGLAVASGVIVGLVGSGVWMRGLACFGNRVFPGGFRQYEHALAVGRAAQRAQQSPMRRIIWMPLLEESTARALPVSVWFVSNGDLAPVLFAWVILNSVWIASHLWEFGRVKWHPRLLPQWTTRASVWVHFGTLCGWALAYTGSWIAAGLGEISCWPTDSVAIALLRAFLAASIAHGVHNALVLNSGAAGRLYLQVRGIRGD